MTIGPRKRVALASGVVTLALLGVVLVAVGEAAGLFIVGALQLVTLAGVAAVGVHLAREHDRSEASAARERQQLADRLRVDVAARSDELRERLTAELEARAASTSEHVTEHLAEHVTAQISGLRGSLERVERRSARRTSVDFAQVEALLGLYADVQPRRALPPTRGWAASPDLLAVCWQLARAERPSLVLECGSGVSTVIFAYACQRNGHGRVVALDHDERFAQRTRQMLTEHGLDGWAEVRTAPLAPLGDQGPSWYTTSEVPEGPIDLVFVDGPPAGDQPDARQPALEVLFERLSLRATIVVDDYIREGEQEVVAGWLAQHPELSFEKHGHEKGTAVLRR